MTNQKKNPKTRMFLHNSSKVENALISIHKEILAGCGHVHTFLLRWCRISRAAWPVGITRAGPLPATLSPELRIANETPVLAKVPFCYLQLTDRSTKAYEITRTSGQFVCVAG